MSTQTTQNLKEIYVRALRLHIPAEDLPETNLLESLAIDSIKAMEIFITVETEFNIEIDNNSLSPIILDSIANLASYVERKAETNLLTGAQNGKV
jgi:acyl carrier protein